MGLKGIRLNSSQVSVICSAFRSCFLENDHLWLFGSRADLSKKGGDIDLYAETSLDVDEVLSAKLLFARKLFLEFDERKIDIVIRYKDAKEIPIYKQAIASGVQII